jgi:hypothetical protein
MPRLSKYTQSIAHHEAGHAVAAWSVGIEGKSVSIIPSETYSGVYRPHPGYFAGANPDWDGSPAVQRKLESRALVDFAGAAAQRRFNPKGFRWTHCATDHEHAQDMILRLCGGDAEGEEAKWYWKLIEARANSFVRIPDNWRAIRAVARALLKHRELSGERIVEIITST